MQAGIVAGGSEMNIFQEKDGIVKISGTEDHELGIILEYAYIQLKFGKRNQDWELMIQTLYKKDSEWFDRLEIMLKDGRTENIIFNISEFFPIRKKKMISEPLPEPAIPESWGYKNEL
jgi:hypothetical protein